MLMLPKPNKNHNGLSSYCPIVVLHILDKAFKRILAGRLREIMNTNNILRPFQYGFRPGKSTQEPFLKLQPDVSKSFTFVSPTQKHPILLGLLRRKVRAFCRRLLLREGCFHPIGSVCKIAEVPRSTPDSNSCAITS